MWPSQEKVWGPLGYNQGCGNGSESWKRKRWKRSFSVEAEAEAEAEARKIPPLPLPHRGKNGERKEIGSAILRRKTNMGKHKH